MRKLGNKANLAKRLFEKDFKNSCSASHCNWPNIRRQLSRCKAEHHMVNEDQDSTETQH